MVLSLKVWIKYGKLPYVVEEVIDPSLSSTVPGSCDNWSWRWYWSINLEDIKLWVDAPSINMFACLVQIVPLTQINSCLSWVKECNCIAVNHLILPELWTWIESVNTGVFTDKNCFPISSMENLIFSQFYLCEISQETLGNWYWYNQVDDIGNNSLLFCI